MGGCRIGEVAGGGDCHGLLANNVVIMEDPSADKGSLSSVVVEALLEHSKTGFARYLDMAGTTGTSHVEVAKIFMDYFKVSNFTLLTTTQAGVRVLRPDFWVVRVSLLGLGDGEFDRLMSWLRMSREYSVTQYSASTESDARRRLVARGAQSQEKKYINVASGDSKDKSLPLICEELTKMGFHATVMPGPLLLATTGGKNPKLKSMPLAVSSTFAPTKELLEKAYSKLKTNILDPDTDLDLDARREPRWTTHSLRRLADTTARRYMSMLGFTEAQVDIYFGWSEKILLKAMQLHYASLSIRERMKLAGITGML